ncbi:MAG: bifunctional oligoribonuclease/PAP phosphatase NrnA [Candidatus Omnitrophica bacterium]|nr:bifunctional oligoribonuclease/PAP phosphatase NrnA [Candidatus Omnitrophota bacterium]
MMIRKQILDVIKKHKRFLIAGHVNPEGDAIGSQLAMANLLKMLDKKVRIINTDGVPKNIMFIPGAKSVELFRDLKNEKVEYEVAIILDSPTLDRIGDVKQLLNGKYIINIDHHVSNREFGNLNWVDPRCSSVGEMIYDLFKSSDMVIDDDSALCVYVAIMTDTGSFRYSNTTARTHQIAAELLLYDIDPKQVYEYVYETKSFNTFKLLAEVLANLKRTDDAKFIWFKVTNEMLSRNKLTADCCEDFIAFVRMIDGAEVVAFLKEMDNKSGVKVSFRSKTDIDVNKIAEKFGGGGHKAASGCVIEKSMDEAEQMLVSVVEEAIRKNKGPKN